jgi:hypothetical protein
VLLPSKPNPALPQRRESRSFEEKFEIQLDEEGAEKITTVQEAADLIAGQSLPSKCICVADAF